jgi:sulfite reductase alpha subunit-like flavoprotein
LAQTGVTGDFEAFKREFQEALRKLAESSTKKEFHANVHSLGQVAAKITKALPKFDQEKAKQLEDMVKQQEQAILEATKKFVGSM